MKSGLKRQLATGIFLLIAFAVQAQWENPHIGYVYPAGGQQGSVFEVTLGGQHLDNPHTAYITGNGVDAEIIEHIRPLNQGAFKSLQNRVQELKKKRDAAASSGKSKRKGRGRPQASAREVWTAEDEQNLAEMRKRLATFSIRKFSVPALAETVTLQVTVNPDAKPGRRELRLQGKNGLSNPMVFCVGQLPEIAEESARSFAVEESQRRGGRGRKRQKTDALDPSVSPIAKAPEVETDIAAPIIINGQILPGDVDRYRFPALKGQQLVVEVSARELIPFLSDAVPGWFQAAVVLFDEKGNELAYEDDFYFRPDPVLYCEIPEDGRYMIEIRDALYRGREDFVYRIALGELPYISHIFPLGGRAGSQATVKLHGYNLEEPEQVQCAAKPGIYPVSTRKGNLISNRVPLAVDALPECREQEPNNKLDTAQRVNGPAIVNGIIDQPGDVDAYVFKGKAGATVIAEVKARRLGSPLDSALKLTSAKGVQLAYNDDYKDESDGLSTHHADSRLRFTIPANGLCCLHITDTQHRGGPEFSYRLHINVQRPDFELRVVPSVINARAGTTVPFTVYVCRKDGFSGEIALVLKTPPPGFGLSGARVPSGQDAVQLTLTVPEESALTPHGLALEGRAVVQQREVVRTAVPADDMT